MENNSDEKIHEEIDGIVTALLNDWGETQNQLDDDEDPETHFKLWVIEKLARAMAFAGYINGRLPDMQVRIEYLEEGKKRPGL
ncbi:MAG: hypothetical protein WCK77_18775 [Verrucomicrobiota bacterium]